MEELLNINIEKLSKEELNKAKNDINLFLEPYNNTLHEIYKRISEINTEEYLKSRAIKNYPILINLLDKLGQEYKDVIIDLDEFLGIKRYSSIRIYGELRKSCDNRMIKPTEELYKLVENFMIENSIVVPQYEVLCPRCHDRVLTFISNPKSDTFIEDLKKEIEEFCEIEDNEIWCDECETSIDLTDDYNIQQSDFYKIIRK
jgi:uncharacterized protein YlaI